VLDAGTLHVAPLDRANLRETIVRSAERAPGLDFEPGLVDRILDDAGSEPGSCRWWSRCWRTCGVVARAGG
jgi:hypothetical protein